MARHLESRSGGTRPTRRSSAPGSPERRQVYRAERLAREARGRARGKTKRQSLGHAVGPRRGGARRLDRLGAPQRASRERALDALRRMRRDGLSLTRAARRAGTTPDAVRRYAGNALERDGSRWRPKGSDRLVRRQWSIVVGPAGHPRRALVETSSSAQASEIGRHNSDIGALLSVRTSSAARAAARARLAGRHGARAGRRAYLPDGAVIDRPAFYADPDGLVALAEAIDLADIDYGSSAGREAR